MQPRSGCADPQNPFFLSLLFCRFSDCRLFCWFSSAFASIPSASLCFCFPLPNVRESLLCCTRLSSALADRLRRLLIPSPDLIGMQGSNNPQSLSGGIVLLITMMIAKRPGTINSWTIFYPSANKNSPPRIPDRLLRKLDWISWFNRP